jgi:rod shape-determining protein MreD
MAVNMVWGRVPGVPDLLAVLLVFWSVHQPLRVGIGTAFFFGLCMDVHQTSLLGQHALSYTVLSFLAIAMHRRLLWFTVPSQAMQVLPLFVVAHAIELLRMLGGGIFPGWWLLLAPLVEAVLWPLVSVVLLAPQRMAPDPDKTRPL